VTQVAVPEAATGSFQTDPEAERIIQLRNREQRAQENFRTLWQDTADLIFPRENQITSRELPGTHKALRVYDTTAIRDSQEMASGLSGAIIPTGGPFFGLKVSKRALAGRDDVQRYLHEAAEIAHEELFESNFVLQLNETLRSLVVFGTGNLYTEWNRKAGRLNFKDYDIGTYQMLEDARGQVDTVILTIHMTYRQAVQEFGVENLSQGLQKAAEAAEKGASVAKSFEFIHIVRPRTDRKPQFRDARNMPFESVFVEVKGKKVVKEGGFEEFPFAVARWMKSSGEKYGRGQGTEVLPDVRVLQTVKKDLLECGNKHNNPPLEVLDTYEGTANVSPGALNYVQQLGSLKAIDRGTLGNFPITQEVLQEQRNIVHEAFYRDLWRQLADLTHRQTTVEVRARLREGLRRMASPAARIHSELLKTVLSRTVLLLIRNGRIPPPPEDVQGAQFGIEYVGELALALQEQQADGFTRLAEFVANASEAFPGITDNINADRAVRRLGRRWGVHTDDLATEEEVVQKRRAREEAAREAEARETAEAAAKAYHAGKDAPEEGSPAAMMMGAEA